MTASLYRIAPLKWHSRKGGETYAKFFDDQYFIQSEDGWYYSTVAVVNGGTMIAESKTLKEAKSACQSHWEQTLSQYLEKVDADPTL